jgi:hypothetical protein
MTTALLLGSSLLIAHWGTAGATILAIVFMLHGLRSFSSVVGHHMTHGARVLSLSVKACRFVYNLISAIFLLPSYEQYGSDHQKHHAYAAGPKDTDQRFIAYLGARFDGFWPFVKTILDPVFHYRFLRARLTATFGRGPLSRKLTSGLVLLFAIAKMAGWWLLVVSVRYQVATLLQWSTEHLWGRRPDGLGVVETATAITYGRLLIPAPPSRSGLGWIRFWLLLTGYVIVRLLLVSGDLGNHDLHHVGKGPWTEAAPLRARVILDRKISLVQTIDLRSMFCVAFQSARQVHNPLSIRKMDDEQMLGM